MIWISKSICKINHVFFGFFFNQLCIQQQSSSRKMKNDTMNSSHTDLGCSYDQLYNRKRHVSWTSQEILWSFHHFLKLLSTAPSAGDRCHNTEMWLALSGQKWPSNHHYSLSVVLFLSTRSHSCQEDPELSILHNEDSVHHWRQR